MSEITIYHNPRCSKSRQTLQLLTDRGISPRVVEYLQEPPTVAQLQQILGWLGCNPRDLLRSGEAVCRDLGLDQPGASDQELLEAMAANPILIQRPIVVATGRAAIGRPPEQVLEIL